MLEAGEGSSGGVEVIATEEEVFDSLVLTSDAEFEAAGSLRAAGQNELIERDCAASVAADMAVSALPTSRSTKRVWGLPAGGLVGRGADTAPSEIASFSISSSILRSAFMLLNQVMRVVKIKAIEYAQ